jgi:ABC-type multidrug transport system ATPase subunit
MAGPIIAFDRISKSFGKNMVIKELSLSIRAHEIFGIIGRSGAGKSTLLKMLIGFYPVDSGSIRYQGKEITNKASIMKRVVGFCTQENSFYPELTVLENTWYYGRLYGIPRMELKKRQKELLQLVDIYSSRDILAGDLSGGMKRRLDFAISLIHHPQLLILDEPTTGLDPITEKQIWDLIKGLSKRGVSIIVISHMLAFVEKYCDTIGFLDAGKIVLRSSPEVLRKKYGAKKTFAEVFEKVLERKK